MYSVIVRDPARGDEALAALREASAAPPPARSSSAGSSSAAAARSGDRHLWSSARGSAAADLSGRDLSEGTVRRGPARSEPLRHRSDACPAPSPAPRRRARSYRTCLARARLKDLEGAPRVVWIDTEDGLLQRRRGVGMAAGADPPHPHARRCSPGPTSPARGFVAAELLRGLRGADLPARTLLVPIWIREARDACCDERRCAIPICRSLSSGGRCLDADLTRATFSGETLVHTDLTHARLDEAGLHAADLARRPPVWRQRARRPRPRARDDRVHRHRAPRRRPAPRGRVGPGGFAPARNVTGAPGARAVVGSRAC